MSSLKLNSDLSSFYAQILPLLAYNSSKTAVNAITIVFANEFRDTNIKVNSVSSGYVPNDLLKLLWWQLHRQERTQIKIPLGLKGCACLQRCHFAISHIQQPLLLEAVTHAGNERQI